MWVGKLESYACSKNEQLNKRVIISEHKDSIIKFMFEYVTRIEAECLKYMSAHLLIFLFIYHQFIPHIFPPKLFKIVTLFDFFFLLVPLRWKVQWLRTLIFCSGFQETNSVIFSKLLYLFGLQLLIHM